MVSSSSRGRPQPKSWGQGPSPGAAACRQTEAFWLRPRSQEWELMGPEFLKNIDLGPKKLKQLKNSIWSVIKKTNYYYVEYMVSFGSQL